MQFYKAYPKLLSQYKVKFNLLYLIAYLAIFVLLNCQIVSGEDTGIINLINAPSCHTLELKSNSVANIRNVHDSKLELYIELEDIFERDSKDSKQDENNTKVGNIDHCNTFNLWSLNLSHNIKSVNASFLASLQSRPLIPLYIFYLSRKIFISL